MSRMERRAERVRSQVPIEEVLSHYGYEVLVSGGSREQQFRCDLHGDGRDNKPSARCYPSNNSWFCWACNRSRDALQTVREKEGVPFHIALEKIEKQFKLPPLPWEDDDREEGPKNLLEGAFDPPKVLFQDEAKRVQNLLQVLCKERSQSLLVVLSCAEEYDRILFLSKTNQEDCSDPMAVLRQKVISILGSL